eukprot:1969398-Prymnesium_polylepis.1
MCKIFLNLARPYLSVLTGLAYVSSRGARVARPAARAAAATCADTYGGAGPRKALAPPRTSYVCRRSHSQP